MENIKQRTIQLKDGMKFERRDMNGNLIQTIGGDEKSTTPSTKGSNKKSAKCASNCTCDAENDKGAKVSVPQDAVPQTPANAPQQVQQSQQPQQINLESSKNTLAKRPWKLGAIKTVIGDENGNPKECWVAAVIDADGKAICCGDAPDIDFIIKLENSYNEILKLIVSSGMELSNAYNVLKGFELNSNNSFNFKQ